ncbi:trypsin-like peptidase domain-containing protein [bacterium]|nr:trypsin-like peptidase domain-containing protein [bacterium]
MAYTQSKFRPFLIGMAVGVAVMFILWRPSMDRVNTNPQNFKDNGPSPTAILLAQSPDLLPDEKNTIAVFQENAPSVVFITNRGLQQDFFTLNETEIPQGAGSGFIWDTKGHVVTNYHVIQNAHSLSVKLNDQKTFEAEVVGSEPNKDIAVVRIKAPTNELKAVQPGSSDKLLPGQKVIAIGNPFGLDQTLTVGVVSAIGREIQSVTNRTIRDVIQTDAAINPGNSGGPLLDAHGRLIGMNTAIVSPSGAYAGIGFAVPVNTIKSIVPELIQHGKIVRPGLGVNILPDQIAENAGIDGVVIATVVKGGAADKAGLEGIKRRFGETEVGDVITAVDGKKVRTADELATELERHKIGDEVTITYQRDGKEQKARIRLQEIG